MKMLLIILIALFLSACVTDQVRPKVASMYDDALESAEMTICNDGSVGSVKRRYWGSAERARQWRDLCFGEEKAVDVLVEEYPKQ